MAGASEAGEENVAATLTFADGSVAQIVYTAFGDPSLPKERLEVLGEAGAAVLDDYRELRLHRGGRETTTRASATRVTPPSCARFVDACRAGEQPWPVAEMAAVMRATFAIRDAVAGRRAARRLNVHILLVSQFYPPESGATQNRLGTFAEGLVAARPPGHGRVRAAQSRRASFSADTGAGQS